MSTATLEFDTAAAGEEFVQYRAIYTGAIVGLVLAIVSAVFMSLAASASLEASLWVAPLPLLGVLVSVRSLIKIGRESESYTGQPIALLGLLLSLGFLVGGVGYSGYVFATEVPEGYTRVSFSAMKPDTLDERSGIVVPSEIAALDGKRVFIKGYIRPDSIKVSRGIKNFLLVRDNNQCCFGDLSKISYYDQMYIDMVGSRTVDYTEGVFRMAGVLKIEPRNLAPGSMAPVFSLKADYAKW